MTNSSTRRRTASSNGTRLVRRRMMVEELESRRVLAAAWRNPLDSLDVNHDRRIAPLDALVAINQLNRDGGGGLPARSPDSTAPFYDVNGDNRLSPLDALIVINALNRQLRDHYTLGEGATAATEMSIIIGLGQETGSRTYRFSVNALFDASDDQSVTEDTLAVYLKNLEDAEETLLDRGVPGTALFTLAGSQADYAPGTVRYDGGNVEIDLTEVEGHEAGRLVFQLINSDTDEGSVVSIQPLSNDVDDEGRPAPRLATRAAPPIDAGPLDFTALTATEDLIPQLRNVRFDSVSGEYRAELQVRNAGPATGRTIAVALTGLPDGVTLRNASGVTPEGTPYLNLTSRIGAGGLAEDGTSAPVEIVIESPTRKAFALSMRTYAGPPNRPPTLAPLAGLELRPGEVAEIPLVASDPDGDPLRYRLQSSDLLPTGRLQGSNLLVQPTPEDVGNYRFTVIASDGSVETSQEMMLQVVADSVTTTRVSGKVLDTDGTPLAGMQVEVANVQGLTLSDGSFLLDLGTGPMVADTLKVRGEAFTGSDDVYPFIAERLPLVLEHPVYAGVNNVIARPIYLPKLDQANGEPIDPEQDTLVTPPNIDGASVFVAAGTLLNQQGTPFTGTLSITEVPTDFTPAALPENLIPDLVVTIQPGEMVFSVPAPLSLPNRAERAPGSVLDLWSINPVTGTFDKVGNGRVSEDGATVDTTAGGIRNSSWHFFAPPPPEPDVDPSSDPYNRDETCPDDCNSNQEWTSRVDMHSGAVIETHQLVTYNSLGTARGVRLVYDSLRADPQPIVHFGLQGIAPADDQFLVGSLVVERGTFRLQAPGYEPPRQSLDAIAQQSGSLGEPLVELEAGENIWQVSAGAAHAAIQSDLRGQPTGVYDYELRYGVRRLTERSGTCVPNCRTLTYRLSGTMNSNRGQLVHVDGSESPYGSGWGIAGLQHLVENPDGSVLLVDGDGSESVFGAPAGGETVFVSPPEDFSTMEKLPDGTYRRTFADQTVHDFDANHRLESIVDRNGNTSIFTYDDAGRLMRTTDPVGAETQFQYNAESGLLQAIVDPADRITVFEHDPDGNLIRVIDPDPDDEGPRPAPARTFRYDDRHLMTSETDPRGFEEQTFYDAAGRAQRAVRKDGQEIRVLPLQTVGAVAGKSTVPYQSLQFCTQFEPETEICSESEQVNAITARSIKRFDVPLATARPDSAVGSFVDAKGYVSEVHLNRSGQMSRREDAAGASLSFERDATNLVVGVTNARGHATRFNYDDRGNVVSMQDSLSQSGGEVLGLFHGQLLSNGSPDSEIHDSLVIDVNNDGRLDLVTTHFAAPEPGSTLQTRGVNVRLGGDSGLSNVIYSDAGTDGSLRRIETMAAADFSGDGFADLILVNISPTFGFYLMTGNGDGTFSSAVTGGAGFLRSPTIADINEDSHMDVAFHARGSDFILFLGNGDGTFQEAINLPTDAVRFESMTAADVNSDGHVDLIGSDSAGRVFVVLGNGDGTFQSAVANSATTPLREIITADLDKDGHLDLIGMDVNFPKIVYGLGGGDGTFSDWVSLAALDGGLAPHPVDMDGDGKLDIALAASARPGQPAVYFPGRGDGTFGPLVETGATAQPTTAHFVDLDGDGDVDIVRTHKHNAVSILDGLGVGRFTDLDSSPGPTGGLAEVALVDYDDDGILDLITAGGVDRSSFFDPVLTVFHLQLGNGDGTFQPPEEIARGGSPNLLERRLRVVDLNQDGMLDLVTTRPKSIVIRLGEEDGGLGELMAIDVADTGSTAGPLDFAIADLNADGFLDAVTVGNTTNKVLLGDAEGKLQVTQSLGIRSAFAVDIADVNGDGNFDVVIGHARLEDGSDGLLLYFEGRGDGTFVETPVLVGEGGLNVMLVADFDQDGLPDLAYNDSDGLYVQLANGDGFGQPNLFPLSVSDAVATDIDADGDLDIFAPISGAFFGVLANDGNGNFELTLFTSTNPSHRGSTYAVGDLDLDGRADIVEGRFGVGDFRPERFIPSAIAVLINSPRGGEVGTGERRLTYEPDFNQLSGVIDELGRQFQFETDPQNGNRLTGVRVVGMPDAESDEDDDYRVQYTYTDHGLLDSIIDPLGRVTKFEYDAMGRRQRVTFAQGTTDQATRSYEYDVAGNRTVTVDERGNRSEYTYDRLNNLIAVTQADPDGQGPLQAPTATFTYDASNNRIGVIDARNQLTQSQYDSMGRLSKQIEPAGDETHFQYDASGNLGRVIDAIGEQTQYAYDSRNRLVEMIDAEGHRMTYGYDADNNLTSVTDANGNRTVFVYDARNRRVREIDPLGNVRQFDYDPADQLVRIVDRDGRATEYVYDQLGRRVQEIWDDGTQINYQYDLAGRLLSLTDPSSALNFTYDDRDRLSTVGNQGTATVADVVLGYEYDAAGNVLSIAETVQSTQTSRITYAYDTLNRVSSISQQGDSIASKHVNFAYNSLGQIQEIERFADLAGEQLVAATTVAYDSSIRVQELRHTSPSEELAFHELTYDAAGNVIEIANSNGVAAYTHDALGQLLAADYENGVQADEAYRYDAAGNRLSSGRHGSSYLVGEDNRLLSDGVFEYQYDAEGHLIRQTDQISGNTRRFAYDHRSRLIEVTDDDADGQLVQRVRYTYDALNRRISKLVETNEGGRGTYFVYDGNDIVLEFVDEDGSGPGEAELAKRYLHGPAVDQVLAQEDADGEVLWPLSDHLGTIADLVDSQGQVQNHLVYDAFGNLISPSDANAASRYRYTGREFDGETGLYFYRARYYDAATGRFLSKDPAGFSAGDANLYRYVGNSPLVYGDPSGKAPSYGGQNLATEPCPLSFDPIDEEAEVCRDVSQMEFGPGNQLLDEGMSPRSRPLARRCGALAFTGEVGSDGLVGFYDPRGPTGVCTEIVVEGQSMIACDTQYIPAPTYEDVRDVPIDRPLSDPIILPVLDFLCDFGLRTSACSDLTPEEVDQLIFYNRHNAAIGNRG